MQRLPEVVTGTPSSAGTAAVLNEGLSVLTDSKLRVVQADRPPPAGADPTGGGGLPLPPMPATAAAPLPEQSDTVGFAGVEGGTTGDMVREALEVRAGQTRKTAVRSERSVHSASARVSACWGSAVDMPMLGCDRASCAERLGRTLGTSSQSPPRRSAAHST